MPFDDIVDQAAALAPAGKGPDVFIGPHDRLGELVAAGVAEPLDLKAVKASLRPVAVQAFTYGGQTYGLPYLTQGVALFYNRGLLGGASAPATGPTLRRWPPTSRRTIHRARATACRRPTPITASRC